MKINKETYKQNLEHFKEYHAINFGVDNVSRIVAVVLICNLTQAIRKSAPETQAIDVIDKILNLESMVSIEFWYKLSFWCESLLSGDVVDFPDFGFVDTKAKVAKIKEIDNNILPF